MSSISISQLSSQLSQQELMIEGSSFYCRQTNSPSVRLIISYPQRIKNLTYNFQMSLTLSIQKILPRLSYNQVLKQTIYLPKKEIILNHLLKSTMYKIQIKINKGINQQMQKTVFVFTETQQQLEEEQLNEQQQQQSRQSFTALVKENIRGYFQQYHHSASNQNNNQKRESVKQNTKTKIKQQNYHKKNNTQSQNYRKSSYSTVKLIPVSENNIQNFKNNQNILCNSQAMVKFIGENDSIIDKKKLQKYILQARKSKSTKQYLETKGLLCFNHMNKVYKNQTQRRQHLQKTLLVTKAMSLFGEIYQREKQSGIIQENGAESSNYSSDGNSRFNTATNKNKVSVESTIKGRQFFRNDWFMGPFYSYDKNEQQMKTKNTTTNIGQN